MKTFNLNLLNDNVELYGRDIIRYVMSMGLNEEDARDVFQITLVSAWRAIDSYSHKSSVRGWLFGISRRQALQFLRARRRGASTVWSGSEAIDDVEVDNGSRPIDEKVADRDAVSSAVAALPIDLREVVVLSLVVGVPLAEIAQVQGVPLGTVKSRLHTARQRLKAALADTYPERASARGFGGRLPDGAAGS